MSTPTDSLAKSQVGPNVVALLVVGATLLGIAALGLELYGAWRICALHPLTIPQISRILFDTSVGHGSFWENSWLSLPVVGLSLILLAVIVNFAVRFPAPYSGGPRDKMKEAVWTAIAPVRSLALPYGGDAIWHKGDGRYDENLCGLKLYQQALFRRHMAACLVIRLAPGFYDYPKEVQFAIDFWRRDHQTKTLWKGRKESEAAALSALVQKLEEKVRELAQSRGAGRSNPYPADWLGQPFISWFPEALWELGGTFIAGAAICTTVFVLGVAQAFLAGEYNWGALGPIRRAHVQ